MLRIRQDQYDGFRKQALASYRKELLDHFREFAPELYSVAGDEQFYVFIDYGIDKATRMGLKMRGPVRLLLEIMCMIGQDFDVDPQYRPLWPDGNPAEAPMPFAQRLRSGFVEYLNQCIGANDRAVLAGVLRRISEIELNPATPYRDWIRDGFSDIYPQKLAYMGEQNLSDFLIACDATAATSRITQNTGKQVVVLLGSCFGVGFLTHPLYPWISKRLLADAPEQERVEKTEIALRFYASKMAENMEKGN